MAWAAVGKVATGAFKALGKVKKGTWKAMKGAYKEAKGVNMGGVMEFVQSLGLLDPILKPLGLVMKILAGTIKENLAPMVAEFLAIVSSPEVIAMIQLMADGLSFLFALIYAGLMGTMKVIGLFIDFVIIAFKTIWDATVGIFNVGGKAIGEVLSWIGTLFTDFGAAVVPIWEMIMVTMKALIDIFWLGVKIVFDLFWEFVKLFYNFFAWVVNSFIWLLNLIPGVDIGAISYLDAGGSILETGVAVVHKGEHVLTEDETKAIKSGKGRGVSAAGRWDAYDAMYEQKQQTAIAILTLKYTKRMYREMMD